MARPVSGLADGARSSASQRRSLAKDLRNEAEASEGQTEDQSFSALFRALLRVRPGRFPWSGGGSAPVRLVIKP